MEAAFRNLPADIPGMKALTPEELGRPDPDTHRGQPRLPLAIVLDNIRSGLNVGAIFRTADAFVAGEIWLCGYTVTPPHPEIMKTALGATESVPWRHMSSAVEAIRQLKEQGYTCVPVEQTSSSRSLDAIDWPGIEPVALILGNELRGVDAAVLAECPFSIEIPQSGIKHSLNVATAAGIVLWEGYRELYLRRRSSG